MDSSRTVHYVAIEDAAELYIAVSRVSSDQLHQSMNLIISTPVYPLGLRTEGQGSLVQSKRVY